MGQHHIIMPGNLLLYKQQSMCYDSITQKYPVLGKKYFVVMLKVIFSPTDRLALTSTFPS